MYAPRHQAIRSAYYFNILPLHSQKINKFIVRFFQFFGNLSSIPTKKRFKNVFFMPQANRLYIKEGFDIADQKTTFPRASFLFTKKRKKNHKNH